MGTYKNFWDLKTAVAYSDHTVQQFDINCTTGGGQFKWITAANGAITDIAGIRIKPSGTTLGYWQRIYDGNVEVDWFGVQNNSASSTLNTLGITQAICDTRYGTGLVTATVDNYDTAAIKYAFFLLNSSGDTCNFNGINFSSKTYFVNSQCNLPTNGTNYQRRVVLNGNGAMIVNNSGFAGPLFARKFTTFGVANTYYDFITFTINDFVFKGTGVTGSKGMEIHATYSLTINNTRYNTLDDGLHLIWCLKAQINNIRVSVKGRGLALDWGTNAASVASGVFPAYPANWSGGGGSNTNSNCHQTSVRDVHCEGAEGMLAGIWVKAVDGLTVDNIILEQSVGAGGNKYLLYIDTNGATTVRSGKYTNFHVEGSSVESTIYLRADSGVYTFDRWINDAGSNSNKHLIEANNPSSVGLDIQCTNWGYTDPFTTGMGTAPTYNQTFKATGTTSWYFFKCKNMTNSFDDIYASDSRWWPSGQIPGISMAGSIEEVDCIRYP